VPGVIVDYSSREQSEFDLVKEIEKSNVICIVYAMNDDSSKEKLASYWLPKINEIEETAANLSPSTSFTSNLSDSNIIFNNSSGKSTAKRPIVIVANKCDTSTENNLTSDALISKLIISNPQIETCIQCSAKTLKNVPEVFYYAQKSVLYPTTPVYDVDNQKLTPLAIKCFSRIFKLCDNDNNGLLDDDELNEFQLKCFGVRLNSSSLQEVKSLLNMNNNANVNENLVNNEITLNGFLFLNGLFFKKGRHETSWTILKKFGYDRNLSVRRDYASIK
jgi:Ca2+-binding EF-hand superfamily protein